MGVSRRGFLRLAGGAACSVAAHPLMTPVAMASAPGDGRLVVMILRGAMDGLDVVRPVDDPRLAGFRPQLLQGARGTALTAGFELHPALDPLSPLWRAGQLSFAHAVSTPYRDGRSHFDGQDILEAGTPGLPAARDGWLNRLLTILPGARGETAYAVGGEMRVLSGPAAHSSWTPGTRFELSAQGEQLLDAIYHDDPAFAEPMQRALAISGEGAMAGDGPKDHGAVAGFAAGRLRRDARIAAFTVTGWDTHRGQRSAIRRPLGDLAASILRLKKDLGRDWDRTAVLAMTEFGRTVRQNGSDGTDHGTGGVMLLAGGAVKGGMVHGRWPGLADGALFEDRDLMPTSDVRAYAAAALAGLFGVGRADLERVVFPGLDLSEMPSVLA